MPGKGELVYVEGYGAGIYVGADFSEETEDVVLLKFEGTWDGVDLDEGYGSGIIKISHGEFDENRVYPEQVANGKALIQSTEKRDAIFRERFK